MMPMLRILESGLSASLFIMKNPCYWLEVKEIDGCLFVHIKVALLPFAHAGNAGSIRIKHGFDPYFMRNDSVMQAGANAGIVLRSETIKGLECC